MKDTPPPYNIEQVGENALRITVAVAGFGMDDLDIEVENNQLTIRGSQKENPQEAEIFYLYRGIAARQFQRSFVLADGIIVENAWLDNGLLHIDMKRIDMKRIEPEFNARKIAIKDNPNGRGNKQAIDVETHTHKGDQR